MSTRNKKEKDELYDKLRKLTLESEKIGRDKEMSPEESCKIHLMDVVDLLRRKSYQITCVQDTSSAVDNASGNRVTIECVSLGLSVVMEAACICQEQKIEKKTLALRNAPTFCIPQSMPRRAVSTSVIHQRQVGAGHRKLFTETLHVGQKPLVPTSSSKHILLSQEDAKISTVSPPSLKVKKSHHVNVSTPSITPKSSFVKKTPHASSASRLTRCFSHNIISSKFGVRAPTKNAVPKDMAKVEVQKPSTKSLTPDSEGGRSSQSSSDERVPKRILHFPQELRPSLTPLYPEHRLIP